MSALDVAEPGSTAPRTAEAALARRRASSSPRTKRPPSPNLARRRSVRSMKQLLPLALPSTCHILHAQERQLYAHGNMATVAEPTMDECNFPELLARDLDLSSLVFAAKNMTAGPPSRNLAYDEDSWHTPATSPRALHSPQDLDSSALVPPIVRFKSATLDAHEHSEKIPDDQVSLSSSSSASGHCFSEVEPASDARHQSVITSATSVTGGRNSALSQKRRNSAGHDTNASWIDFEPDLDAAGERNMNTREIIVPKRPASGVAAWPDGRTSTRQRASTATGEDGRSSDPFANFTKPRSRTWSLQLHHQNQFFEGGPPLNPVEIFVPQRRSSLRNQLEGFNPTLLGELLTQTQAAGPSLPSTPIKNTSGTEEEDTSALVLDDPKDDIQPWFRYMDREEDDGTTQQRPDAPKDPTAQSSPTDNVQTWLEDSLESVPLEDQSRRMRLPPEVLDTLRVSTSCFPETMLLCSSLSIETIRSYSRKFKHPTHDGPSRLQTPPPSPKRWKWSSMLGQRRSSSSLRPPREPSTQRGLPEQDAAMGPPPTSSSAQPPWPRFRNVFPSGPDYLLDTLYAHLVAYTYVSSFCHSRIAANKTSLSGDQRRPDLRRCSTPDRLGAPESPRKSRDSNNDIPRKAASLLGLQDATGSAVTLSIANASLPPSAPPAASYRLLRKRSSFLDNINIRASRLPPPPTADTAPLRELQLALGRCIARIVTALRAGVEGDEATLLLTDEDPKVAEIDPVLIRTLCEIVRCCEDNVA